VLRLGGIELSTTDSSWIVPMAQPFRAHAKDLLEIQHYPRRLLWPGGPPEQPYDVTGWTLPLQMGVSVRALSSAPRARAPNDIDSSRMRRTAGVVNAANTGEFARVASELAVKHRVTVASGSARIKQLNRYRLARMPRIAVYRPWTGNMDEGWCR